VRKNEHVCFGQSRRLVRWGAIPAVLALAVAVATAGDASRTESAGLRFAVPTAWGRVPATSDVRAAQFRIPRAEGDPEDGELVLFFFGASKGGGVEDNLTRWYGQFTQPDGRPSRDAATLTIRTVRGLKVTAVDLAGTYAGMGPGSQPKPGMRLLAAIVEGSGGPWFWKAVGPAATLAQAKPGFDALLDSLAAH
jgi:hypothetical protein